MERYDPELSREYVAILNFLLQILNGSRSYVRLFSYLFNQLHTDDLCSVSVPDTATLPYRHGPSDFQPARS